MHSSREEHLLRENAELRRALEAQRGLLQSVEDHRRLLNEVACFCIYVRCKQCMVPAGDSLLHWVCEVTGQSGA